MTLYRAKIHPISRFGSTLKGDMLFGQLCWAFFYLYGKERLDTLLLDYAKSPFLVVSDGFASGHFPKPTMPSRYLKENQEEKKENRKKVWLTQNDLLAGNYTAAKTNKNAQCIESVSTSTHNAINYKTFNTGDDGFDPYSVTEIELSKRDIYFLISNATTKEELHKALLLVCEIGYGKKSSTGKGRFEIEQFETVEMTKSSTTFMALSPFVAHNMSVKALFYEPFTRFGKTGANRAKQTPFKDPILMADKGAVVVFDKPQTLSYVGKGIENISAYEDIVHQGYSIVIPLKEIL